MRVMVVVLAAAFLDLGVRFLTPLEFERVLLVEGVVFLAACGTVLALERTAPAGGPRRRAFRRGLAAAFGLGGLRSLTWGAGAPVMTANLVTLGAAAILVVVWWRSRRPAAR